MLSIQRILLPTDFSPAAVHAESHVRAVARLFGAELHILHVTSDASLESLPGDRVQSESGESRPRFRHILAWLTDEEQWIPDHSGERTEVKRVVQESDEPSRAILRYAEAEHIDLIVMGTTGQRLARGPLFGFVTDRVVRQASCPVVTIRPDTQTNEPDDSFLTAPWRDRVLVVPVDLSSTPVELLTQAKHWAATFRASLDVIHVIEQTGWQRIRASAGLHEGDTKRSVAEAVERRGRLRERLSDAPGPDVPFATRILFGQVAETITAYADAQKARFMLLSTGSAGGLGTYLMGGVTDYVLRHARCPVAALPIDNESFRVPTDPKQDVPPDDTPSDEGPHRS